jgi:hypothetical protein
MDAAGDLRLTEIPEGFFMTEFIEFFCPYPVRLCPRCEGVI